MHDTQIHVPFIVTDLKCEHGSVYSYSPKGDQWKIVTSQTRGCTKKSTPANYERYVDDEEVQEDYNYFSSHWLDYDVNEEI